MGKKTQNQMMGHVHCTTRPADLIKDSIGLIISLSFDNIEKIKVPIFDHFPPNSFTEKLLKFHDSLVYVLFFQSHQDDSPK